MVISQFVLVKPNPELVFTRDLAVISMVTVVKNLVKK